MLKRNTYYYEKLWVTWSFLCRLLSDRWRLSVPCLKLWFMFQVTHNYNNIRNVSHPYWIPCTWVQYLWLRRFLAICKHTSLVAGQKAGKMVLCRRPKYAQDSSSNMNFHVVDYAADDDEVIVVLHGRHEPEVQLPGRKRERERFSFNFAFKEET